MTARDEILARIADALADVPAAEQPDDVVVPRDYQRGAEGDVVERFVARASEYRADVRRVARAELSATVAELCRERGLVRLGVPADLPAEWIPDGIEARAAELLDPRELDTLGAAPDLQRIQAHGPAEAGAAHGLSARELEDAIAKAE